MSVGKNNGIGNLSASVLLDDIKSHMSGTLNWTTLTSDEKWIFSEHSVTTTGTVDMITTGEMFLGTNTATAAGDKIFWVAIKHTGYSSGTTSTDEGILISHTGATPVHSGSTSTAGILIEPGELFVAKFPQTTIADLHAITCNISSTGAISAGTGNVAVQIAALLKDVG